MEAVGNIEWVRYPLVFVGHAGRPSKVDETLIISILFPVSAHVEEKSNRTCPNYPLNSVTIRRVAVLRVSEDFRGYLRGLKASWAWGLCIAFLNYPLQSI